MTKLPLASLIAIFTLAACDPLPSPPSTPLLVTQPALPSALTTPAVTAGACPIIEKAVFAPQNKTVALVGQNSAGADARLVVFSSPLRVNTDGAPNSYHPNDPTGERLAINNIANGIAIRASGTKLSGQAFQQAFARFRDNNWVEPSGISITWKNVIAARNEGGRDIPCVFRTGDHQGYFGSLTRLQNGLTGGASGECQVNNQLDQRFVPALVLAGGNNPVAQFGGKVGDLVVAVNPANGQMATAIVGDTGPPDNLGEGSVALNMTLLGQTTQPQTYGQAKKLDTGPQRINVAVIPGSGAFQLQRPHTAATIQARVTAYAQAKGYGSLDSLARQVSICGDAVAK